MPSQVQTVAFFKTTNTKLIDFYLGINGVFVVARLGFELINYLPHSLPSSVPHRTFICIFHKHPNMKQCKDNVYVWLGLIILQLNCFSSFITIPAVIYNTTYLLSQLFQNHKILILFLIVQ